MFSTVLVANRGEIALRVMRACRELGLRTIAVYSEADRDALHVQYADDAYLIGPPSPAESYLNIATIIDVARRARAGAIHPGYGFLAENPLFARHCIEAGLVFIGPSPEAMERMGGKVQARREAAAVGVPLVPGTTDPVSTPDQVLRLAERYGYPIAIKAARHLLLRRCQVLRLDKHHQAGQADRRHGSQTVRPSSAPGARGTQVCGGRGTGPRSRSLEGRPRSSEGRPPVPAQPWS